MNPINLDDLFYFEQVNKDFFEKTLPPRPATYNQLETFKSAMEAILEEQARGDCYMYLIRGDEDQVLGRINLVKIQAQDSKSADFGQVLKYELGYRLSEKVQGKGYGTKALSLIIEEAKKLKIQVLEAGTSTLNIGSQKILIKNGFTLIGQEEKVMQVKGQWLDGLLYSLEFGSET
jgi:ribosomal-protein-alanine N-acetyltransferase